MREDDVARVKEHVRYLLAIEVTRRSVSRNGSNVMMVHHEEV
jgi:hypothetical protein